jgi:hypothetical protein
MPWSAEGRYGLQPVRKPSSSIWPLGPEVRILLHFYGSGTLSQPLHTKGQRLPEALFVVACPRKEYTSITS